MLSSQILFLKRLPPPIAKLVKWLLVYPRYWKCRVQAGIFYRLYRDKYKHPILFIAGMPKSGTTWLEKMISSYPGYCELLMPSASFHELRTGNGHIFDLPSNAFAKLKNCLVLTKMHCHGSAHNIEILRVSKVPYVVLYRDLRDVAVSYYFYVLNTPWHADYKALKGTNVQEGIRYFIQNRLPEFSLWMRSWRDNRDVEQSLMVSYEEMLDDTSCVIRKIFTLFGLEVDEQCIQKIVMGNSFKSLESKDHGKTAFFRKGKSGDWVNYFTPELRREFCEADADILIEFGYEVDEKW